MLSEICREIRNFFVVDDADKHLGKFVISGGKLSPLDYVMDGQHYRIIGSIFNDGVYKKGEEILQDEAFDGCVCAMRIPPEFLRLVEEISEWQSKNGEASTSPYTSESFGGYSYSKSTTADGGNVSWRNVFAGRLNKWRKL